MATNNDKIQFRGQTEKKATQIVDQMRLSGINISELARLDRVFKKNSEKSSRTRRRSPSTSDTSMESLLKTLQRFFLVVP